MHAYKLAIQVFFVLESDIHRLHDNKALLRRCQGTDHKVSSI